MTHPVLDKWTALDPQLYRSRLNTAHGSEVVTNDGILDPSLATKQVESAFSSTYFSARGPLGPLLDDPSLAPKDIAAALG